MESNQKVREPAQEALAPSLRPSVLRVLEEELPLLVAVYDRHGVCVIYEGRGLRTIGRTPGQFVGKSFFETHPQPSIQKDMRDALAGKRMKIRIDFQHAFMDVSMVPLHDERGEVEWVVMTAIIPIEEEERAETVIQPMINVIERQMKLIKALATPILEVWERVLAVPVLGVIDSARAAEVMESLLAEISRKGARFAILDLTGIETVDTGTAAHLLKLIQAVRLLGAEGIITGIQLGVAQTMTVLGVDLGKVKTRATLRDGLKLCISRLRERAAS